MWVWINIITQSRGDNTTLQTRQTSPWGNHLYNSSHSPTNSSYAQSSYSTISPSSSILPMSPYTSRPCSQQSEYSLSSPSPSPPSHTSCPATPTTSHKYHHQTHKQSNTTPSSPTPYRSTIRQSHTPTTRGVYQTLYRPDLIKLSCPREGRRRWREREEDKRKYPGLGSTTKNRQYLYPSQDKTYSESYLKTDLSTQHDKEILDSADDYSIVCDKLLEELEADLDKVSPKQISVEITDNYHVNHKEVLHINKMKIIQLTDNDIIGTISDQENKPESCRGKYFDNLLLIIEEAVQGLTM